jgi:hypothetical protein
MKTLFTLVLSAAFVLSNAQEMSSARRVSATTSLQAQFLISSDFRSLYFNYVGAGLKYTKKNTNISLTVFPAFRYVFNKSQNKQLKAMPSLYPGLAIGTMMQYKKWLVGFPIFYSGAEATWRISVGLGYTF